MKIIDISDLFASLSHDLVSDHRWFTHLSAMYYSSPQEHVPLTLTIAARQLALEAISFTSTF